MNHRIEYIQSILINSYYTTDVTKEIEKQIKDNNKLA